MTEKQVGTLIGVGVGPGDPELITYKGIRAIQSADVLVYHSKPGGNSAARAIAKEFIQDGTEEILLEYPVTTGNTDHPGGYTGALADFYVSAYSTLTAALDAGKKVVVISIGDPMLYSSYQHLHRLIAEDYPAEIIPGVSSVSAAAARTGMILADDAEALAIISATETQEEIEAQLALVDRAVIMKVGNHMDTLLPLLEKHHRTESSTLVSYVSTKREKLCPVRELDPEESVPYLSVILVGPPTSTTGWVSVVGLGPGPGHWRSPEAAEVLREATDIIGYSTYVKRVPEREGQVRHITDNREEADRARHACELASKGHRVAVVSSGDPGIFAMASPVIEEAKNWEVTVNIVPGISAAQAAAARAGAPLGHDCAFINLSDNLKPWAIVEKRIRLLLEADMAFAVYNPASKSRKEQVKRLLELVPPERIIIQARAVGWPEEAITIAPASAIDPATIDMRTLLIIGASNTRMYEGPDGPRAYTTRYYE